MSNAHKIIHKFFSDKFSLELREKVWDWLVNPAGQTEKEEALMQLWEETDFKADESTLFSYRNFQKQLVQSKKSTPFYILRKWSRVAAVLLIPLLTILVVYLYVHPRNENVELVEYYVPRGGQQQITLPDGTKAYLNSGTLLIYPQKFTGDVRSVYLIGEGNFDVKQDKEHPFIVKTRCLNVKALGTKFNVLAYAEDDKTVTTLESGAVAIQKTNEEEIVTLSPNEQLEYDNSTGEFNKRMTTASVCAGWTKGELNFVTLTLKDIFITLERMYNMHIIVPPHLVTSDVYTIKFKNRDDIREIMNIVTKTIGNIDYSVEDENILLIYSPHNKKGGR
ncbi:FecR family protein [Bacteroides sp.]|uniref:FecR family protein n=1 Tax=Bacteroides sp. TaxID=29523 RepID=UPI0025BCD027|nr:FecR family protein [Bacteroides sp.]